MSGFATTQAKSTVNLSLFRGTMQESWSEVKFKRDNWKSRSWYLCAGVPVLSVAKGYRVTLTVRVGDCSTVNLNPMNKA